MGFSNIAKHKYSWALNRIGCVYLKVNRWYLNKIRCKKKSTLTHCTMVVFCCAYHVHDKSSLRCFYVSLWILWNTKVVGIIMFLWFWNIIWLCVFTLCPNLPIFCIWCARTHTLWHVWVLNVMILSCIDDLCLYMSIVFELPLYIYVFRVLFKILIWD